MRPDLLYKLHVNSEHIHKGTLNSGTCMCLICRLESTGAEAVCVCAYACV